MASESLESKLELARHEFHVNRDLNLAQDLASAVLNESRDIGSLSMQIRCLELLAVVSISRNDWTGAARMLRIAIHKAAHNGSLDDLVRLICRVHVARRYGRLNIDIGKLLNDVIPKTVLAGQFNLSMQCLDLLLVENQKLESVYLVRQQVSKMCATAIRMGEFDIYWQFKRRFAEFLMDQGLHSEALEILVADFYQQASTDVSQALKISSLYLSIDDADGWKQFLRLASEMYLGTDSGDGHQALEIGKLLMEAGDTSAASEFVHIALQQFQTQLNVQDVSSPAFDLSDDPWSSLFDELAGWRSADLSNLYEDLKPFTLAPISFCHQLLSDISILSDAN